MGKLPGPYTLSGETTGTYDDRLGGEGCPRAFAGVETPARRATTDKERLNGINLPIICVVSADYSRLQSVKETDHASPLNAHFLKGDFSGDRRCI